jgi:hypothetical protein
MERERTLKVMLSSYKWLMSQQPVLEVLPRLSEKAMKNGWNGVPSAKI